MDSNSRSQAAYIYAVPAELLSSHTLQVLHTVFFLDLSSNPLASHLEHKLNISI
jgi:hypothetical protein